MRAQISLEHPNPNVRGKSGEVYSIKYKTRLLYQYHKDNSQTENGVIYIPYESLRIYNSHQKELIDAGFSEIRKEIPTDEIDFVEINIETHNATSTNGFQTLMSVSPMYYEKVLVSGEYVTLFDNWASKM